MSVYHERITPTFRTIIITLKSVQPKSDPRGKL